VNGVVQFKFRADQKKVLLEAATPVGAHAIRFYAPAFRGRRAHYEDQLLATHLGGEGASSRAKVDQVTRKEHDMKTPVGQIVAAAFSMPSSLRPPLVSLVREAMVASQALHDDAVQLSKIMGALDHVRGMPVVRIFFTRNARGERRFMARVQGVDYMMTRRRDLVRLLKRKGAHPQFSAAIRDNR
jgi:hypothetical protein